MENDNNLNKTEAENIPKPSQSQTDNVSQSPESETANIPEKKETTNQSPENIYNTAAENLKNINTIKDELCKIPLDICEMEYINNNIAPLLNALTQLSTTSYNLATSADLLSHSYIVHPKKHELKDTIHLTYRINDKCEDIYDVLKKRINFVLKNSKGC